MTEHFDVIVIGAGLSGIGAGCHLKRLCPDHSFAILEARDRIGGTWDLFRYPGIRSDSDMFTLGYGFRPWTAEKAIAEGGTILAYLEETAREHGIDRHIRYRHRLISADWSTAAACWTLIVDQDGMERRFTCNFLSMCAGYYDYARGHAPAFAGMARFRGRIVHPQFWTDDIDYAGKRVAVIGSGATAVTLVPEMAKRAAHVTMVQRSPTYVAALPSRDPWQGWARRLLPAGAAFRLIRWRNLLMRLYLVYVSRRYPDKVKAHIVDLAARELGADYDVATHFTPRYAPWDQRLCVAPDGDLFAAIRNGSASVVTDGIERFDAGGLVLASGGRVDADLVVTATGLEIRLLGGAEIAIDGERFDPARAITYKGIMFAGVPNLAITFGYTSNSWTLKADLTAAYLCRLLRTMRRRGLRQATPVRPETIAPAPFLPLTSGYVQRAAGRLPTQGSRRPWKVHQNYLRDLMTLRFGSIDEAMVFSNPERHRQPPASGENR